MSDEVRFMDINNDKLIMEASNLNEGGVDACGARIVI